MNQSFIYDKGKLHEWQSSVCMIPVLLELIKEKFININQSQSSRIVFEIGAYQIIYKSWQKTKYLNTRQKEWLREIGSYLNAIQEKMFRSELNNPSLAVPETSSIKALKFS